jgi:hypothetical protein
MNDFPAPRAASKPKAHKGDAHVEHASPETHISTVEAAAEEAPTIEAPAVETFDIGGVKVDLASPFRQGHVLTENQAKILFLAYVRQFTNNQEANAKARAARLAKATTDADRVANAPLTAEALARLFITYEPAVGQTVRGNTLEKLKVDMALRYWQGLVDAHNKSVLAGGEPVIARAGKSVVKVPSRPTKSKLESAEAHQVKLDEYMAWRTSYAGKLMAHADHGPKIEAMVEAELAARKADKGQADTAAAGAPVVEADSLLD